MTGRTLVSITEADDPRIAAYVQLRERDLIRHHRRFIAEGTVVLNVMAGAKARANGFQLESLFLLENRVKGLEDLLSAIDPAIPVHVASQAVMDRVAGFHLHRGVLGVGLKPDLSDLDGRLAALPEQALVVAAIGLSNHDNAGALFRNAAVFGADAVLLDETSCDPLYRKALRVSVGAALAIPFHHGDHADALIEALVRHGFSLAALSPRGRIDIRAWQPAGRLCLLAGTEGDGLPAALLDRLETLRVPQAPGMDSLNVATATGIALYEAASRLGRI